MEKRSPRSFSFNRLSPSPPLPAVMPAAPPSTPAVVAGKTVASVSAVADALEGQLAGKEVSKAGGRKRKGGESKGGNGGAEKTKKQQQRAWCLSLSFLSLSLFSLSSFILGPGLSSIHRLCLLFVASS
jgi:hypothetical protein